MLEYNYFNGHTGGNNNCCPNHKWWGRQLLLHARMTYEVIVFLHIYKPRNRWHHILNYIIDSIILRTTKMFANGPKTQNLPWLVSRCSYEFFKQLFHPKGFKIRFLVYIGHKIWNWEFEIYHAGCKIITARMMRAVILLPPAWCGR